MQLRVKGRSLCLTRLDAESVGFQALGPRAAFALKGCKVDPPEGRILKSACGSQEQGGPAVDPSIGEGAGCAHGAIKFRASLGWKDGYGLFVL